MLKERRYPCVKGHLAVIARLVVSQPFSELTFELLRVKQSRISVGRLFHKELPLMERTFCPKVVRLRWTLVSDLVQRPVCFLWMNSPKGGGGGSPCKHL